MRPAFCFLAVIGLLGYSFAAERAIPKNAKVYIAPMGGFETDLANAIESKHVPLEVVDQREKADYEITGTSESQTASTAKKVIRWDWRSNEQASISVADLKTGTIVYSYSVNKPSSAHGKRSTAEACAKHLKEHVH